MPFKIQPFKIQPGQNQPRNRKLVASLTLVALLSLSSCHRSSSNSASSTDGQAAQPSPTVSPAPESPPPPPPADTGESSDSAASSATGESGTASTSRPTEDQASTGALIPPRRHAHRKSSAAPAPASAPCGSTDVYRCSPAAQQNMMKSYVADLLARQRLDQQLEQQRSASNAARHSAQQSYEMHQQKNIPAPPPGQPAPAPAGSSPPTSPDLSAYVPLQVRKNGCVKLRVFYATDRGPGPATVKGVAFGPDQNATETLSYGSLIVSIPPVHTPGAIESPSIWRMEFTEDPAKHVVLEHVFAESRDDFFSTLHAVVATTPKKEAFVFIHGYNVTFEDAAKRAAQLSYDLQFAGAPILYSWPSRGTLSGYNADEESVQWTTPHLMSFLEDVHARSGATTVHLIAHSMGNRALLNALEDMARERRDIHFGQIILAAPDVASSHFIQQIPLVRGAGDHITLYASSKDQALDASQRINHYPRAGQTGNLTIIPPVETIDASAVVSGFMGHSYFGDSVLVLSDMVYLMRDGLPAARRSHLRQSFEGPSAYWTFFP